MKTSLAKEKTKLLKAGYTNSEIELFHATMELIAEEIIEQVIHEGG